MGFKDGTRNIKDEDADDLDEFVWVGNETDQPWMTGGSYLVARRIRMLIEAWDADFIARPGARSSAGSRTRARPLTGTERVRPAAPRRQRSRTASPVIARTRTSGWRPAETNGGQKILRRGYSYTDGTDPTTGQLDAGLFFIALPEGPAPAVRPDPAPARPDRPAQRVHQAHRQRALRRPARGA